MRMVFDHILGRMSYDSGKIAATPQYAWPWPQARWQKCPVCLGKGTVAPDFYGPLQRGPVKCKSCGGRGIVK